VKYHKQQLHVSQTVCAFFFHAVYNRWKKYQLELELELKFRIRIKIKN